MKALHPSDALVDVSGIPDKSAIPSVMINYQSTARIAAPDGQTDPWNFASLVTPHPVAFGFDTPVDSDGVSTGEFHPHLNQQLSGANHATKAGSFLGQVERWRLAYFGVSYHFDGPALSNQGTISVAQVPYAPRTFNVGGIVGTASAGFAHVRCADAVGVQGGGEFPNYDRNITMPNAYQGEIKNGAYIPIKLTKTCQQWRSRADLEMWANITSSTLGGVVFSTSDSDLIFPFPGLPGETFLNEVGSNGAATSPILNDVVAHVCGRNISPAAGLIVTYRVGIEAQVEPGTVLSPYQKVSPEYDPVAMKAYFLVARQLKDAYPVSYNDLGKLWDVISGGLRVAAPVLSTVHPLLGSAATGISALGNAVRGMAGSGLGPAKARNATLSATSEDALKKEIEKANARAFDVRRQVLAVRAPRKRRTRAAPVKLRIDRADRRKGKAQ